MDVNVEAHEKPDVVDIERASLPLRATDALPDSAEFAVVVPKAAWDQMHEHAHVRLDVEVGGVLVGRTFASQYGTPYLLIDAIIPALAAESRETNITFTGEAWARIHEVIDRDHAEGTIVGWYHTHPAFGVFLSEMDVFICRHFFDLPHQVAIVIDPVAKTHGCFIWRAGAPTGGTIVVEGGTALTTTLYATHSEAALPLVAPIQPRRRPARSVRIGLSLLDSLKRLHASQWIALLGLLVLTVVVFGALVMLWLNISLSDILHGGSAL